MLTKKINGITLVFDPAEQETADQIGAAAAQSLRSIYTSWGWQCPADCRMYVMTSWWGFFFQSASWPARFLLALTFPLWALRAQQTWPFSAAWTQRYGKRVVIGIKPPRLLETSDRSVGVHMYVEEKDMAVKLRHLTCHELTHACSADLKLPAWLNEGLAAVTVERFLEKPIIRPDSLELVRNFVPKKKPPTYREMVSQDRKAIAYHAVRGYWLVRLLEARFPGFLKRQLAAYPKLTELEKEIAGLLELKPGDLWKNVDGLVVAYFDKQVKNG